MEKIVLNKETGTIQGSLGISDERWSEIKKKLTEVLRKSIDGNGGSHDDDLNELIEFGQSPAEIALLAFHYGNKVTQLKEVTTNPLSILAHLLKSAKQSASDKDDLQKSAAVDEMANDKPMTGS